LDEGSISSISAVILLVAARAILSLIYGAMNNVRTSTLREQAADGSRASARILTLLDRQRNYQITHQFASMTVDMLIMAVAAGAWGPALAASGNVPLLFAYAVVVVFSALVTMILGVLVPEAVGSSLAYPVARIGAPVLRLLALALYPVVRLMVIISRWISSLFDSQSKVNTVTEEEIMTLVDAGASDGTIEEGEQEMIYSVLQLGETHASELMVPRIDMVAIEISRPLEEARALFIESGHSRIPVFEEDIDTIKGVLYAKDLLTYWHNGNREHIKGIADLLRPAVFVPNTKPADELLKELKGRRVHMAIVVDEYGGTAGIVTIEDLIEEIIGEIQDEYDKIEQAEIIELGDNRFSVDASISIDDFNDRFDTGISDEENDTLAGAVLAHYDAVPEQGAEFTLEHLNIRVEAVDGRRIRRLIVTRLTPAPAASSSVNGNGGAHGRDDDPNISNDKKREKAS
jgi:CBS domain containing-hemolysin-like protein